jgi:hypothetical protein
MTVAKCHSDREAFYFDEESYFYFNTEFLCFRYGEILQSLKSSFRMTMACCHSDREVFYSDEESQCHSDREIFTSTRNLNVIPTEKFLLRRGIFLFLSREILQSPKRLLQNNSWPIVTLISVRPYYPR